MKEEIKDLIERANDIILNTGKGSRARYPKELKDIVVTLAFKYKLSPRQIVQYIPISLYSAREWPRRSKESFRKISLRKNNKNSGPPKSRRRNFKFFDIQLVLISLQILLLSFQIFLH